MNRDNSVIWYVISLGVSMSYLPVKGIQYMINQERIVAVDPLLFIWQAVAIGFSLIALVNQKSKADFTISIMSLIFAIVLAVVVALFECCKDRENEEAIVYEKAERQ